MNKFYYIIPVPLWVDEGEAGVGSLGTMGEERLYYR